MLQPRHATVSSGRIRGTPSCYCELLAIRIGNVRWRNSRSGVDAGAEPQAIRPGATGLMTSFVGWRQAFESAVMASSDSMGRTGNVRTVNRNRRSLEHALAGAAFGALALGSPAMAADMPLKAPHLRPAFDWSGFYIGGHTGYGRGSSSAVLSDPLPVSTTGSVFSGVIGGVQGGYNVQMPSGLLLGVEADLTFPNYLISNKIVSTLTGARSEVVEAFDYAGTVRGRVGYASGHWLVYATGGFAFAGERFINTPDVGTDQKHHQRPPRLGRRRRRGIRLRAALERQARISLQPVRSRQHSLPLGRGAQFHPRFPADPYRPQPQGRLAGIEQPHAEIRPDRSRIRPLGNPRPDHLSGTGLSGIPRALYRHQQPDARTAGAGHLEQQPLSERPALGRRRGLLQSRTAAGLWPERHRRPRRIFQWRGAEVELPLPALQHLAAVCAPDLRIRRRAGRARQRAAAAGGQGRRQQADAAGRQVLGRRRLRRQFLRQGHPPGFHELVDLGARRVRLCRRQARA